MCVRELDNHSNSLVARIEEKIVNRKDSSVKVGNEISKFRLSFIFVLSLLTCCAGRVIVVVPAVAVNRWT